MQSLVAGVCAGVAAIVLSAAPGQADTVPAHVAPEHQGWVQISTVAGGYVDVLISGRGMGRGDDRNHPRSCSVQIGTTARLVALDGDGNGSQRLGPFGNGTYTVSGRCGDDRHANATDLLAAPLDITIDGRGAATGTGGAVPIARGVPTVTQTLSQYCNVTADVVNEAGLVGYLGTPASGATASLGALTASSALRSMCLDLATQIGDKASAGNCRRVADAVYAYLTNLYPDCPLRPYLPPPCFT
ncbi:hypothetical protein [Nocardia stercoris]|uniref:DUF732 domain-containing protein n=1 Tax=Nocardia stercoris TaxID=2483361 RepID=A0A3M2L7W6_9NOCA|nr:hypothetical protein [Nocardia stercoris]RMI32810.1 hypothetical protein EBN03_12825 [Nocardia stercoris]